MAGAEQINIQAEAIRPPLRKRWRPRPREWNWKWLGVVPFFLFVIAFQLFPSLSIAARSFVDEAGKFTLDNISSLNQPLIMNSYFSSIKISLISAIWGGILGFGLAWAV